MALMPCHSYANPKLDLWAIRRLTTNKMYNHCIIVMEKKKKKKKTDCLDTHYCNLTLEATEYWLQGFLSKEKPDKWNDLAQQQPTEQYRFISKVTHRPNPFRFNDQHHYHERHAVNQLKLCPVTDEVVISQQYFSVNCLCPHLSSHKHLCQSI